MYLIDTNVLSELTRPKPDVGVVRFLADLENGYLSVMTLHELAFGLERLPEESTQRERLQRTVEELIGQFSDSVLPVGQAEARISATMRADAQKAGRTLHVIDAVLAATAFAHGLTVLTRNEKDFAGLGVKTFSPWVKTG